MDRLQLFASSMSGAQNVVTTVPQGHSPAELFAAMPPGLVDDPAIRWETLAHRVVASFNTLADVPLDQLHAVTRDAETLRDLFRILADVDRRELFADALEGLDEAFNAEPTVESIRAAFTHAIQVAKDTPT